MASSHPRDTPLAGPQTPRPGPAPLAGAWRGTLMERMGVEVVAVSPERAVLIMPLEGNLQTAGVLHGGASAALAETAASLAAAEHARRVSGASARAVGVELSISHVRPGTGGRVTATARALHLGRTSTVHLVDITDEEGRLISSARVSNRVVAAPPS